MIMLDTNICIYVLRYRPIELLEKFNSAPELSISSIVYAELLYGLELSPKKLQKTRIKQLQQFIQHLSIVPWSEHAAAHYAEIRASLKKKGTPIGNMDLLIGSHARSLKAPLVTNNKKEFKRIPDLKIENWV